MGGPGVSGLTFAYRCLECGWLVLYASPLDCLCSRCGADRLRLVAELTTTKGERA